MTRPPSVDRLARSIVGSGLPHPLAVEVARHAIATDQVDSIDDLAEQRKRQMLTSVINATGVLLHTNLGRAPLSFSQTASYSNLELNVETGQRGSRQQTIGSLLATACGAEAAIVVNNCASAVLLTLAALGAGRGVAVSRGEMVEIGGGFRIPDVMRQSGARLVEVGTTNRSRLSDYTSAADAEKEAGKELAMVLKVHRSNYKVIGFTEEAPIAELATVGVPVVVDLGSGLLDAACPWLDGVPPSWLSEEPAVRQTLDGGADLVMFSGDKLFGGPQAGIIAGRADLVERCAKHPLARAVRPGSLVMAAVGETTLAYLERRGADIPFWAMVSTTVETLTARAEAIAAEVPGAKVIGTEAVPGGGTLPTVTFPSAGLRVGRDVTTALRAAARPIIARVEEGGTTLDLRTVHPDDDPMIAAGLRSALAPPDPENT